MQKSYQALNDEILEMQETISRKLPNSSSFKLLMLKYNIVANDKKACLDKLYIFTQDNTYCI